MLTHLDCKKSLAFVSGELIKKLITSCVIRKIPTIAMMPNTILALFQRLFVASSKIILFKMYGGDWINI